MKETTLGHHHIDPDAGDRKVAAAVGLNLLLTVAQFIGGIFSGSLSLIADAVHNLSDAMTLIIAFAARKIARRPADNAMTFGYGRAEPVVALINYTSLIMIALYLIYEAGVRMLDPSPVDGWIIVIIATIALVVDLGTVALTYRLAVQSENIRAAFLHNLADALGSVGVIVAGTCMILFEWAWVDPAVTLAIAGYILWMSWFEIGGVIRILMLGSPDGTDVRGIIGCIQSVDGVAGVHHVHVWQADEHHGAVQAHLVITAGEWGRADAIKAEAKAVLIAEFGIQQCTFELECAYHACAAPNLIGA